MSKDIRNLIQFIVIIITLIVLIFVSIFILDVEQINYMLISVSIITIFAFMLSFFYYSKTRDINYVNSTSSKNSLNEKILIQGKIGIITYTSKTKTIISITNYLKQMDFNDLIEKKITELDPSLVNLNSIHETTIKRNGRRFELKIYSSLNTIVVRDVTGYEVIHKTYDNMQSAIVLVKTLHYDTASTKLDNKKSLKVTNYISEYLRDWSNTYKGYLRLSSIAGKPDIIFLNKKDINRSLNLDKNNILDSLKKELIKRKLNAIISIGIAYGNTTNERLGTMAESALKLAENRGGDQVVIKEFGSETVISLGFGEIDIPSSKTKTKIFLDFMKKEIKLTKKVIIGSHFFADADAIAAQLALLYLIEKIYGCETFLLIDTIEPVAKKLLEQMLTKDELNRKIISIEKAKKIYDDKTLLIVADTSSISQTPMEKVIRSNARKKKIFIIDHHRASGEDKIRTINHSFEIIEVSASSTAEILTDMISIELDNKDEVLPSKLANILLTGIYLDTKELTKKTSHKTLASAGWLLQNGATTTEVHNNLKIDYKYSKIINVAEKNVNVIDGKYIIVYTDIQHSNITTIISLIAERQIDIKGIEAAVVIAKIGINKFRGSLRSESNFNVQSIAENMGGGGHFNSAAFVVSNMTKNELLKNIELQFTDSNREKVVAKNRSHKLEENFPPKKGAFNKFKGIERNVKSIISHSITKTTEIKKIMDPLKKKNKEKKTVDVNLIPSTTIIPKYEIEKTKKITPEPKKSKTNTISIQDKTNSANPPKNSKPKNSKPKK